MGLPDKYTTNTASRFRHPAASQFHALRLSYLWARGDGGSGHAG